LKNSIEEEIMDNHDGTAVLLVEKDNDLRRVISASLAQIGLRVLEAKDEKEAKGVLEKDHAEFLIVEHDWQHGKNTGVIKSFRDQTGGATGRVLVITRDRLDDDWREQQKPISVLYKPFDVRYLCRLLEGVKGKNIEEPQSAVSIRSNK
jgi:DNA-binding response OmpR family regulator